MFFFVQVWSSHNPSLPLCPSVFFFETQLLLLFINHQHIQNHNHCVEQFVQTLRLTRLTVIRTLNFIYQLYQTVQFFFKYLIICVVYIFGQKQSAI